MDAQKTCPICLKKAKNLENHIERHDNVEKFECDQCENIYSNRSSLRDHRVYFHEGKKRKRQIVEYNCEICKHTFASKSHILVHTKDKPHQCLECEQQFSLIGNLKRHLRIHNGEKNYFCLECPAKFAYSDSLKDMSVEYRHKLIY